MVPIGLAVLEKKIVKNIFPIGSYIKTMLVNVGRRGCWAESSDTILNGDHLTRIPLKFGPNRPSSFRE